MFLGSARTCLHIGVNGDDDNDRKTPKFVNLNQIYTFHGGRLNEKYGNISGVITIPSCPNHDPYVSIQVAGSINPQVSVIDLNVTTASMINTSHNIELI